MNWKLWLYGLLTGVVTAAATAASNVLILPAVINGITVAKLFEVTALNACVAGLGGGLAYLKTHPAPDWDGNDRRGVPNDPPKV